MSEQDSQTLLRYLLQLDIRESFICNAGKKQWQVVYESRIDDAPSWVVFSALLEDRDLPVALANVSWDLPIGNGLPGFSQHIDLEKDNLVTTYSRYGDSRDVRPFVIIRDFHGAWPSYPEICEEFRHFHNLAHDTKRNLLLDFDQSGYEIEVVRLKKKHVEVQLRHLKRFLAATRLNLAIYFDSVRYSDLSFANVPVDDRHFEHRDRWSYCRVNVCECNFRPESKSFSRLLGKVIIPPPPIKEAGVWPFEEDKKEEEVEFIIGVDEAGRPTLFPSSPEKLGTYHYLTPVFFRREVLSKYYTDTARYSVSDGRLSCLGLWRVQIDINHPTHVAVFLGDLGRDLPYAERLHWKQFNVPPAGTISEVNYRRSFLAQFTDPEAPDLVFRAEYARLCEDWAASKSWQLFLPIENEDEHLLQTIRIPVTNSQAELDDQVLSLTKLLVDSLNERALVREVGPGPDTEKGISKFERFLMANEFKKTESVVRYLRDIQELRSSGAGHRKGSGYQKVLARLGIDPERKPDMMRRLLQEAAAMLKALQQHFIKMSLDRKAETGANSSE